MKKQLVYFIIILSIGLLYATTFHTLTFDGINSFAQDEVFTTSTEDYNAYCTWDDEYLYLGYTGEHLGNENDTVRISNWIFWYIDTDPQTDPKTGEGTDHAATVWTQIMVQQPWWFDEQSWELPFYADYYVKSEYAQRDSEFVGYGSWDVGSEMWTSIFLNTSHANLNIPEEYYEVKIPLDSIGNPLKISIVGFICSSEWTGELYWNPDPRRDVGGTYGSWPAVSLEGGDGDKHGDGKFNHWFSFELISGVSPNQVSDPPVVTDVPNQEINEGESFSTIDLKNYVYDDLTPDTSIVWTYSGNLDLIITIDENNVATINIPDSEWNGSETITFTAHDEGDKIDSDGAIFTVIGINDPPEIVNLPDNLTLEINKSTKLYMMNYADDVDTPDSLLAWTFEVDDPAISYTFNEETDTLTVYSHETKGNFNLYATLTDEGSAFDNDTIIVYVADPSGLDFDLNSTPKVFTVSQNFPNPFNPLTKIRYGLPKAGSLDIEIYSITGKKVYSLHEAFKPAGYNILKINAAHWSTGIYFYRIRAEKNEIVKKMMVIK